MMAAHERGAYEPMSRLLVRLVTRLTGWMQATVHALMPPQAIALDAVFGIARTELLGAVVRLGIAEILEKRGPIPEVALAGEAPAKAEPLHRALRALVATGFFHLDRAGRFR